MFRAPGLKLDPRGAQEEKGYPFGLKGLLREPQPTEKGIRVYSGSWEEPVAT